MLTVPLPARAGEPASSVADPGLDPRYQGFIPIPHTGVMIQFNARPRLDLSWDPQNTGDEDRFVTAQIPVEGDPDYGGGARFNMNGKGSQIMIDVRAPEAPGSPRFYYRNDFYGSGGGDFPYRLRDLYGRYHDFLVGLTESVFADPDIQPETVDYEGPNALATNRKPQLRYRFPLSRAGSLTCGLEKPDSEVDGAEETIHSAPDCAANARWEKPGRGHLQFSFVGRAFGAQDSEGDRQIVLGWGVNGNADLELTSSDTFRIQLVGGEGIGTLGNDASFYDGADAAYDGEGDLKALAYFSALAGITHAWSDDLRSTVGYGFVNLENEAGQPGDAYHRTQYANVNLVYQILPTLMVGWEGLYGSRETKDGSRGNAWRIQTAIVYSIFE